MTVLSSALRGAITASPGHVLYVADYAAIEARVLLWLAKDEAALNIFREGRDIYNEMATSIFRRPIDRKKHKVEGALGKVAILGLGFQMGPGKFVDTALTMGGVTIPEDLYCEHEVDDEVTCDIASKRHKFEDHPFVTSTPDTMTSVKVVDAYRAKFWKVKNLWGDTEAAAIKAVLRPGKSVPCGRVVYHYDDDQDFLFCTLPSGRRLAYPDPNVVDRRMPWGDMKPSLTYMGTNAFTRKWSRQHSYGGLLVENNTQATARDLMAAAMLRCEMSRTYQPVLTIHDEMIAEARVGTGSVDEFEALMAKCPPWAEGLPVTAAGWTGSRYRK